MPSNECVGIGLAAFLYDATRVARLTSSLVIFVTYEVDCIGKHATTMAFPCGVGWVW